MKPSHLLILAGFITLLFVVQEISVGKSMHNARVAFDASNRAWVAPVSTGFVDPLISGKPIRMDITVSNVGRDPASDVQKSFVFRPFPISAMQDGSAMQVVAKNDICKGVMPSPQATVIYPGSQKIFHASWYPNNLMNRPRYGMRPFGATAMPLNLYNDFMSGKQALVVQSCVAYNSLGKRRYSAFCNYFVPGATKESAFNLCEKGNYTDEE